ncbi:hypothetical protein GALMADRAFT_246172 [Galerina marginata CBS 339.88]|uniref:Hydrophobin n=1 Tax=Galerina marginata (strain CBS 339.88) TaxID=685588 RepID=A0A067T1L1_GALM3|nr:hypothetical protein GALMADRAFT_246172 [Galerina marginata CBS 339.88]
MKFTTVVAVLAAAVASVESRPSETNADRLARGLPPLPPTRRATPIAGARRSSPSGISNSCNTGPVQCCNTVTTASNPVASLIIGLLGLVLGPDVAVGLTCSPLTIIGVGSSSCSQQPVCCENNSFNGLIAIGCSPININL